MITTVQNGRLALYAEVGSIAMTLVSAKVKRVRDRLSGQAFEQMKFRRLRRSIVLLAGGLARIHGA